MQIIYDKTLHIALRSVLPQFLVFIKDTCIHLSFYFDCLMIDMIL